MYRHCHTTTEERRRAEKTQKAKGEERGEERGGKRGGRGERAWSAMLLVHPSACSYGTTKDEKVNYIFDCPSVTQTDVNPNRAKLA